MEETPEERKCYFIPDDSYIEGAGYRVSIVVENQPGHRPTGTWPYTGVPGETRPYFWGHDFKRAQEAAQIQNKRMGLSEEDVAKIVASSMRLRSYPG